MDSTLVDDPEKLINTNFNPNTNNNTNLNMSNELEGNEMAINNLGLTNGNNKKDTLVGRFTNYISDPDNFGDFMGRLGTFANRLTLDPDPQYAERMNQGRLLQQQLEKQNRTADVLENMGYPELAQMMRNGEITGANALTFIKSKEKTPTNVKEFQTAKELNLIGEDVTFEEYVRNKSGTNIVDSNYRDKALFEIDRKRYEDYSLANANIGTEKQQLDLMESLLDDGLFTGGGANIKLSTYRLAEQLGLTSDETNQIIANTESFQAFSNRVILGIMGGSLGVGFSDGDRAFTEDQAPNIGNSIQGNRDLIKYMKEAIKRKLVMKTEMEKYLRGGERRSWDGTMKTYEGGLNAFDIWAYNFAEDNPIFPQQDTL